MKANLLITVILPLLFCGSSPIPGFPDSRLWLDDDLAPFVQVVTQDLAREHRDILLWSPGVDALPLSESIAEEAARLRAIHNLQTSDAIQWATAKAATPSWFLTNDEAFTPLPDISVLLVDRLPDP